jgi:prevent-host-death family protein
MAEIRNQVTYQGKHYTLTCHGKGVAVIISLEEWKAYKKIIEKLELNQDIKDADAALEKIKKGEKTISHSEACCHLQQ